jgi:DNA replication protein DnaC
MSASPPSPLLCAQGSQLHDRQGRWVGGTLTFDELQVAHGDGSFARRLVALAKLDLLVIDDFAISPMGPAERNDLLEMLDDRIGTRSTLITSQLPVKAWHTYLNDPTLADAILDRVVHSSHKIELKGTRSMREGDAAAVA